MTLIMVWIATLMEGLAVTVLMGEWQGLFKTWHPHSPGFGHQCYDTDSGLTVSCLQQNVQILLSTCLRIFQH